MFKKKVTNVFWVLIFLPLFIYNLNIKTFENFENSMLPYKSFLVKWFKKQKINFINWKFMSKILIVVPSLNGHYPLYINLIKAKENKITAKYQ